MKIIGCKFCDYEIFECEKKKNILNSSSPTSPQNKKNLNVLNIS